MKSFIMMCATLLTATMAQAQFVSFPSDCAVENSEACVDATMTDAADLDVERFQRPDRRPPPRPGDGRPGHHGPGDHHRPPPMPPGGGYEPPHHRPPRPGYPDRPTYPNYPSHPGHPSYPGYPNYPSYPDRPTYPDYPTYPDDPTYPNQPPYNSGYLPSGSYLRSCQACDVQGPMLTCECRSSRGQWFWSSIDTRSCYSIANIEGTLRCE